VFALQPFLQTTCDAATVQINTLQSIVPNFTIVYSKVLHASFHSSCSWLPV
jgi:hypothetical protein